MAMIHKLLGLKSTCSKDDLEKEYKKYLIKIHPDRSKIDTKTEWYEIRKEYKKFIEGNSDDNFYCVCSPSEIHNISCRCGTKYDINDLYNDKVECSCCSCYILIEDDILQII